MKKQTIIKLEETELKAIKDLSTLNCEGISCRECPLFLTKYEHCIVYYSKKLTEQLKERGYIPWQN